MFSKFLIETPISKSVPIQILYNVTIVIMYVDKIVISVIQKVFMYTKYFIK